MLIDEEAIKNRMKVLDEDIQRINEQLVDLERKKTEAVSMLNALGGAKQQCVNLITELHNDDDQSNGSSDDS